MPSVVLHVLCPLRAFPLALRRPNRNNALRFQSAMNKPTPTRRRQRQTLWLTTLLLAGALVTSTAAPLRAADSDEEANVVTQKVVMKATPKFVETLLDKLEFDYKPSGKTGYLIKLEGVKMLVLIESSGGLMLYCGFQGVKVDTKKINEWNKKQPFSRGRTSTNRNDPVLESDLDFDGGVTLESLKIFITVFKSSAMEYKKFLAP